MFDPNAKILYLQSLDESRLRATILLPLLRRMGLEDVLEYHGGGAEKGKDIVCRYKDPLGELHYVGIVVKRTDIHGAVGKKGSASEVLFQVEQTLNEPFSDVYSLDNVGIRECWVITSGIIKNTAIESIRGKLGKSNLDKLTRFIDRDKLITLIDRFWNEFWVNDLMIENLAHSLFAPVASTKSRALFMAGHPGTISADKLKDVSQEIIAEMDSLERTIETVATLHRDRISLQRKRVNLHSVVTEAIKKLGTLRSKHSIEIDIGPSLVLDLDMRTFRQALSNILENSIIYSGASATPIEVRGFKVAEHIVLQIRDWGIGIPEGWEDLIFHVGIRAPNAPSTVGSRAGLGLYLARALVELHQGKIRLTSRTDPTEFSIYLPLAEVS
jgi:signal transduction histidine kinase